MGFNVQLLLALLNQSIYTKYRFIYEGCIVCENLANTKRILQTHALNRPRVAIELIVLFLRTYITYQTYTIHTSC